MKKPAASSPARIAEAAAKAEARAIAEVRAVEESAKIRAMFEKDRAAFARRYGALR